MVNPDEPIPVGCWYLPMDAGPTHPADPTLDLFRISGKRIGKWERDDRCCFRICDLAVLSGHFQPTEEITDGTEDGMPSLQRIQFIGCLLSQLRGVDGGPGQIVRFPGSVQPLPADR